LGTFAVVLITHHQEHSLTQTHTHMQTDMQKFNDTCCHKWICTTHVRI